MTQPQASGQLTWLLDNLASQAEHIRQALAFSGDGLVVAASEGLGREDAERLAALAASVQSLARGAGQLLRGGEARQTIIEMDSMFLFVTAAGEGTCLAVTATAEANVGVVAYEMAMLVRRMGKYLVAGPRPSSVPPVGSGIARLGDRPLPRS
jgi:predicted regulator of Ras-like GTPase activity (Roadblock/LC7/MglB family)